MKAVLLATVFLLSSCATNGLNRTTTGAATGTAVGAGLGAIIGSQSGDAGAGTAIGAAAGAIGGALIGTSLDQADRQNDSLRERVTRQDELIKENQKIIDELRRRGADARPSERGVVVNLPDVLFSFDRASLTRSAKYTIAEIAEVVAAVPDRLIAVEGHTDSIGSVAYNKRLSVNRAQSVAKSLERNGIPARRMVVRGFGEGAPIATNNSEAGRARNRRVEVIIEN